MTYQDCRFKYERIAFLKEKLATDQRWAVRGLTRIYEFQTADEQAIGMTREYNDVGFSGVDAEILSSFAEQVLRGRTLSPKQMAIVFKKMPKYARQLDSVAQTNQQEAA